MFEDLYSLAVNWCILAINSKLQETKNHLLTLNHYTIMVLFKRNKAANRELKVHVNSWVSYYFM